MFRPLDQRIQAAGRQSSRGTRPGKQTVLAQPRSGRYTAALRRLDASAKLTPVETAALIDDIFHEFHERWASVPLGIVSCCYLGSPFEVHTLDADGSIIEHYAVGRPLPGGLERARQLARADTYLAIEVYPDRLLCVRADGAVVTVEN
jgi:hypothetical protein